LADRPKRSLRGWLGIYLRGMMMGVAELVPGVSGGTIAFVTGIYDELVHTLAGLRPRELVAFRTGPVAGIVTIWQRCNVTFLVVLLAGMATSVVLLAHALSLALENVRPVVWGFFLGIIVLSIWLLGRDLPRGALLKFAPLGILAGIGMSVLEPFAGQESLPVFFVVGAIAVSAWLLPAVSGSFVLLTLGLYEAVIGALAAPHWDVLVVFLSGCATGLLLFSKALAALLDRWRAPLLSLLTGFMTGASLQLWPWQVDGALLGPGSYAVASAAPAYGLATVVALMAGAGVIVALSRLER
jgi:putative membrane protein